jgi:hypothetical protein
MKLTGRISWFGGSKDTGVGPTEEIALYPGTLARHLDRPLFKPYYCAMRWNYTKTQENLHTSRDDTLAKIREAVIIIRFKAWTVPCMPVDWGPARSTGRLIDVGPEVIKMLHCQTDDVVEVELPDWLSVD